LPKEFGITDSRLTDISDEQLDAPFGFIHRRLAGRSGRLRAEESRRSIQDRLKYYKPYPKQRDFRDADARSRERLLMTDDQFRQDRSLAASRSPLKTTNPAMRTFRASALFGSTRSRRWTSTPKGWPAAEHSEVSELAKVVESYTVAHQAALDLSVDHIQCDSERISYISKQGIYSLCS